MGNIGSISSRVGAGFTSACDSVGSFAGRVVCQLKNAGKAFCNLMSSLWEKIVTFIQSTPTDEEIIKGMTSAKKEVKKEVKSAKRDVSDWGRTVGRSVSDMFKKPTLSTRVERGGNDAARYVTRGFADFKGFLADACI